MIAIDTSALIAIFRMEPEAERFLKTIVGAEARIISALSVLEASMVMIGRGEGGAETSLLDEFLLTAAVRIVPFDAIQADLAREAFQRFGKGRHKAALNLGDCASYALAKSQDAPLLFKGADFIFTDIRQAIGAPA
jgi:ribonuclease VapC